MNQTFAALADPTRCRIVELLLRGEHAVGDVARRLELAQPSASKHLKTLERVGLVTVRRDAQRRWYRLRPGSFAAIDEWLAPYRRLWADRLDALEHHLDQMEDTEDDDGK